MVVLKQPFKVLRDFAEKPYYSMSIRTKALNNIFCFKMDCSTNRLKSQIYLIIQYCFTLLDFGVEMTPVLTRNQVTCKYFFITQYLPGVHSLCLIQYFCPFYKIL